MRLRKNAVAKENIEPVRLAGLVRCWIVKKYCWLVWCERKILFRLEIYDRLWGNNPSRTGRLALNDRLVNIIYVLSISNIKKWFFFLSNFHPLHSLPKCYTVLPSTRVQAGFTINKIAVHNILEIRVLIGLLSCLWIKLTSHAHIGL